MGHPSIPTSVHIFVKCCIVLSGNLHTAQNHSFIFLVGEFSTCTAAAKNKKQKQKTASIQIGQAVMPESVFEIHTYLVRNITFN